MAGFAPGHDRSAFRLTPAHMRLTPCGGQINLALAFAKPAAILGCTLVDAMVAAYAALVPVAGLILGR